MRIRTRMCTSLDGNVTTPDGWPVQLADPNFVPGQSYGFPAFQQSCDAALMGRTTFEPALSADRWPWPNLDVFVLASHRPAGTPEHVVVDNHPERLLEKIREANRGGRCAPRRRPAHDRDLPPPRCARPARADRPPPAHRAGIASHAVGQQRRPAEAREPASPSRRLPGDALRVR